MLSIYGWCMCQFKIGNQLRFFFVKDRTAPEANCSNSFLRIIEMQFHRKKKDKHKQKATRACLKVCRKTHENTWNYKSTLTSYER